MIHVSVVTHNIMLRALKRNGRPSRDWWQQSPLRTRLRRTRQLARLSQQQVAARAGYSDWTIKSWELGWYVPTAQQLADWQAALEQ